MSVIWNPSKYLAGAFGNSRIRAATDLLVRTSEVATASRLDVRRVLDLGCGPGNMTGHLKNAFPQAQIHGVDSSSSMIDTARKTHAGSPGISFDIGGIEDVSLDISGCRFDVIYSNAALHWVLDHPRVLPQIMRNRLTRNGVFAFQMPDTRVQPSHLLMEEAARRIGAHDEMFLERRPPIRIPRVEHDPSFYVQIFHGMNGSSGEDGTDVDIDHWTTEYVHHLPIEPLSSGGQGLVWPAEHPVCAWTAGSGLMPITEYLGKNASDPLQRQRAVAYMAAYNALLYAHYPPLQRNGGGKPSGDCDSGNHFVMLGYKRYFCVVSQTECVGSD
jgi:trans-aconitate 2-methyltransferase